MFRLFVSNVKSNQRKHGNVANQQPTPKPASQPASHTMTKSLAELRHHRWLYRVYALKASTAAPLRGFHLALPAGAKSSMQRFSLHTTPSGFCRGHGTQNRKHRRKQRTFQPPLYHPWSPPPWSRPARASHLAPVNKVLRQLPRVGPREGHPRPSAPLSRVAAHLTIPRGRGN